VNINGVCTTPSPAPVATLSVTPSSCTIAAGDSKTKVNVSYATSNATTVKLVNGLGTTLSTALSAGVNVDAFLGSNDYQVTATGSGGTTVQSAKATCTCAAGSVANGAVCAATDSTKPVLSVRGSTPAFSTTSNTLSATIIVDSNGVLGANVSRLPLGYMTVVDSSNAGRSITVNFTDASRKAVQLVASGLSYATAYTATFALPDLAGNTTQLAVPFTTPAEAVWWPPATITPMGVKVFGANQLPEGCTSWLEPCWKEAVRNGIVKFVDTPAKMVGLPTANKDRSVVFAYSEIQQPP